MKVKDLIYKLSQYPEDWGVAINDAVIGNFYQADPEAAEEGDDWTVYSYPCDNLVIIDLEGTLV